ncbi:PH domain-containing protein [uncultured Ruthenibacterium sp.]|uniref:PH domain-containing protein n=1 Tax=uncultured Ruthenibacterium sp. TaxID=1905347 RepID=UPI00349EE638
MEFRVTRSGAALIGFWAVLAGILISLPFWALNAAASLLGLAIWCVICVCILIPRWSSCRVRVGGNHLTVRRGILFLETKRMPLRFITGCRIVQTPLGRRRGGCVLVLIASGTSTIIPGIRRSDAEQLAAKLSHGGKLL